MTLFTNLFGGGSGSTTGLLKPKGAITTAANFPTTAAVKDGWWYTIAAAVTDNDPTKTNTGQAFIAGDDIYWYGSAWVLVGENALWGDDATDLSPINSRNVKVPSGKVLKSDTISELTSAAGVTVDSVLLKDGNATAGTVYADVIAEKTSAQGVQINCPLKVIQLTAGDGVVSVTGKKDEKQSITPNVQPPNGGTYTITFDGHTTAAIAFDANATAINAALSAASLSALVATGSMLTSIVIEFTGAYGYAPQSLLTCTSSLLFDATPVTVIVAETQLGVTGTAVTGVGTTFATTFDAGDTITIETETKAISAIAGDTAMTTAAFSTTHTSKAYSLVGGTRFKVDGDGNTTLAHGAAINEFSIDDTLAGASDESVPTEKAVKGYVDTGLSDKANVLNTPTTWASSGTITISTFDIIFAGLGAGVSQALPASSGSAFTKKVLCLINNDPTYTVTLVPDGADTCEVASLLPSEVCYLTLIGTYWKAV